MDNGKSDKKPKLGISACLTGEPVRFNGGHKRDQWLMSQVGPIVEWTPVCPELQMGLGAPRESMRLVRSTDGIRLIGNKTQQDYTELAQTAAATILKRLPADLDGFILKNGSPSCGVERVKVYDKNGSPFPVGQGFFAQALQVAYPNLPIIEEGRLHNQHFREHYFTQVFTNYRLKQVPPVARELQKFHRQHKYLLLAHHETLMRQLGRIAADCGTTSDQSIEQSLQQYRELFAQALKKAPTLNSRTNALQHMYGHVKKKLSDKKRNHLTQLIDRFRTGEIPYFTVLTLLWHEFDHFEVDYCIEQELFQPHPQELRLMNVI